MVFFRIIWLCLALLYAPAKMPMNFLNVTEEKSFYIDEFKIILEIHIEENLINLKNDIIKSSSIIADSHKNDKIKNSLFNHFECEDFEISGFKESQVIILVQVLENSYLDTTPLIYKIEEKKNFFFKIGSNEIKYAYDIIKIIILNQIKTDNEYLIAFIEKSPRKLSDSCGDWMYRDPYTGLCMYCLPLCINCDNDSTCNQCYQGLFFEESTGTCSGSCSSNWNDTWVRRYTTVQNKSIFVNSSPVSQFSSKFIHEFKSKWWDLKKYFHYIIIHIRIVPYIIIIYNFTLSSNYLLFEQ